MANWSTEDIEIITNLWNDGRSSREIGLKINRTRNAIIGKVHRLNLSPRRAAVTGTPQRSNRRSRSPWTPVVRNKSTNTTIDRPIQQRNRPPAELIVEHTPKNLSTLELTNHTCHWPVGEFVGAGQQYCGNEVYTKTHPAVYCAFHTNVMIQSRSRKRKGIIKPIFKSIFTA